MRKIHAENREGFYSSAANFYTRVPEGSFYLPPPVNSTIRLATPTNITQTDISTEESTDESPVENWNHLDLYIKADTILIQCLIEIKDLTRQQAITRLAANKRVLNKLLPMYLNADLEAIWQGLFSEQQNEINVDLNIKKFFYKNPSSSYQTALNYSLPLLQREELSPVSINEIRLYHLKEILNKWVDWDHAKIQLHNSLQVLKAVMSHYQRPFPHDFFQHAFAIENFPDIRLLDESALLWNQLDKGDIFQGIDENGQLSSHLLEQNYFYALSKASYEQKIIDKLFSPILTNSTSQNIYFNGLAFRNAKGMFFSDFINCTELEVIPEYQNLTFLQRQHLLKEKFYQIGESIEYEIGSLFHSLASILMRIYYYQVAAHPSHNSQKHLLDLFKHTEENWEQIKNYPIQPRLLLALHLAESNNITFVAEDWKTRLKELFEYLAAEFENVLLEPPQFDRISAAAVILTEKGMSYAEINQKRYYVMVADDPDLSMTYYGTPLEQFFKIADWDGLVGKSMFYQGVRIEPKKALQQAEERFNSQLFQDPWVQKKAIDNLKHQHKAITLRTVEQEAKRIAEGYEVETENHRTWIRGLKTWVSTIPIIGSLYAIEEGIRDKDPVEVICGLIFLSLDALDLLSGSEHEPLNVETNQLAGRLSVREKVTIDTVHSSFKKLNLSPADLPLDDKMHLAGDPFSIHYSNEIPAAYRLTAEQVRSGVQDLTWRDYPLIHLVDENRVVPVKAEGGSFREINWYTGEVEPKKHLIYKDRDSGKYFSHTASLRGGGDVDPAGLKLAEGELRQRITVKETEEIFANANDYNKYNFDNLFNQCFTVEQPSIISGLKAQNFYQLIYKHSPTFRRIFNHYHELFVKKTGKQKWNILIEANALSRTDFKNNIIYLGSNTDILNTYYISSTNNFVPSSPEQVYLHEMLHALTGKVDPLKIVDIRHRGPIVYLTDKILSEAGYVFPQRIMYRRLSQVFEADGLENFYFQWSQYRKEANLLVAQENTYLDRLINSQVPITEYKKAFGEESLRRYTIMELDVVWARFNTGLDISLDTTFRERFVKYFTAKNIETLDALVRFYTNLYVTSKEFSTFFDIWSSQSGSNPTKWRFELSEETARAELPVGKQTHCLSDLTKKIYIFDDGTYYLSAKGLIEVEKTHQLVHEIVQVMTGLRDPSAEVAFKNRGAVVQITNKIFEQAKLKFEKRLVYKLVTAKDFSEQTLLLGYQLEASRAAQLEDSLIKTIRTVHTSCTGCRGRRSFPKKRHLPIPYSPLFLKKENLAIEMEKIQTKLKKYGITPGANDATFVPTKQSEIGLPFFANNTLRSVMDAPAANTPWVTGNYSLS